MRFPLLRAIRPRQWPKNAFVFAALVFAPKLGDPVAVFRSFLAFVAFCLAAGSVYLINDIRDVDQDRLHPRKRFRPIAAGEISIQAAWGYAGLFFLAAAGLAVYLDLRFAIVIAGYILMNIVYSFYLKNEVILDVLILAIGFVLRVYGGGLAIDVEVSSYLWLCTILLAMLLALGKRRHEILMLEDAESHRAILREYSPLLLEQMMAVMTASTLMAYVLYTQDSHGVVQEGRMIWTVPFVIYGIFRYLYLIHKKDKGGDPAELLLEDWRMQLNVLLWLIVSIAVIYFLPDGGL
jgi:4-hydroxybenzoate polyprenyltransferase